MSRNHEEARKDSLMGGFKPALQVGALSGMCFVTAASYMHKHSYMLRFEKQRSKPICLFWLSYYFDTIGPDRRETGILY